MSFRTALIAITFALLLAAPASAAEVSLRVDLPEGVRLGNPTEVNGRVTEAGIPLAARIVALEVRRYPFDQAWQGTGITATTAADGSFELARKLDRNHHVRVRLVGLPSAPEALSPLRVAYVLPAFTLAYDQRGTRVRLKLTYTVPRDVALSAPTRFYVGPCRRNARGRCKSALAPLRARAQTRRVRAGRYLARARVRIPRSYRGEFQSEACFVYSPRSGMGNPDQRCPRRASRLP